MSSFDPISASELKCLDKVRSLLDKLGPSEINTTVDFLFGKNKDDLSGGDYVSAEEEGTSEMEVENGEYEQPPEKKIKVEKNEKNTNDISTLLEECSDLSEVWDKISNHDTNNLVTEKVSEKALERLMNTLSINKMEDKQASEYFISVVIKSILHLKIYQESYEHFFESLLLLYPTSCHYFASQLVMEPNFAALVICMINMDLMTKDQEKSVLLKWLTKFSIESNTLELPKVLLSRNTKLYEDSQVVGALATSFAAAEADSSDKCAQFAKFLLQVLGKVASIEEKAAKNFKLVTERNKTFLRKRLDMEVDKKSAS